MVKRAFSWLAEFEPRAASARDLRMVVSARLGTGMKTMTAQEEDQGEDHHGVDERGADGDRTDDDGRQPRPACSARSRTGRR